LFSGERSHPWFTCKKDCVMLHNITPQFDVFVFNWCCFSQWPPWFTCRRDCDMLHKVCREPTCGTWREGGMHPCREGSC
jgi:hypothetical protein